MTYSNLNHTYIIIMGDYLVKSLFQKIFNRIRIIPSKNLYNDKAAPCTGLPALEPNTCQSLFLRVLKYTYENSRKIESILSEIRRKS